MPPPATIGLAVIARDEEATLPGLLASITGAFDQVALLDTGSADRTVEVFEAWAEQQPFPLGYVVEAVEWRDDFAAARRHADSLLGTAWLCNADADDEIRGARNLRAVASSLHTRIAAATFAWDYLDAPALWRTRLHRRGAARWSGRVHETLVVNGPTVLVPAEVGTWFHRRRDERPDAEARDLRIARRWARGAPDDPHALATAATAEIEDGDRAEAIRHARAYLALPGVLRELGEAAHAEARAALDRLATEEVTEWELPQLAAALGHRPPSSWAGR
jgi:glycosyltransferase involved in cell wall biosynthesis